MSDLGLVEEQQTDTSHDSSISSAFPEIISNYGKFESLKTTPLIIAQTVFVIAIETYALFVTFFSNNNQFICESYFILLYLHVIFWFISFAIHHITELLHHQLWLNGFFDFHAETKSHQRLPLYVTSFFTVNLLLLQTVTQHFYDKTFDDHCEQKHGTFSSPTTFVTGAVSLETILLLIANLKYIFKVRKFNKEKQMPDALKPDSLLFTVNDGSTRNYIDFKHETQHVFTFIEKQAEMIQYLRDHVSQLNGKLSQRMDTHQQRAIRH